MAAEIRPALNAAEWAEMDAPSYDASLSAQERHWRERVWDLKQCVEDAGRPHALAALALHRQPFGFDWAMVEALQLCVAKAGQYAGSEDADAVIRRATEAIQHIAALLPSRPPADDE